MAAAREHTSREYRKKAIPLVLVRRVLLRQQRRLYARYARCFPPRADARVLDLGVNAALEQREQYYFQTLYPYRGATVAAGLEPPDLFTTLFPDVPYVQVHRGEPLPFPDSEFDVVHCAAVIEHVGNRAAQLTFLREILRVGRSAFVSTPNRWFPVEFHTMLPFVHWLPTEVHRPILRSLGFDFFSREENMNLLDRRSLLDLVPPGRRVRLLEHTFLGLPSNLILVVEP